MSIKNILRKISLIIFSLIFSISLSFLLITHGLLELTEYNTLQPIMIDIFSSALTLNQNETEMQMSYNLLLQQCENPQTSKIEIPLGTKENPVGISSVILDCNEIKNTSNYNDVVNLISKNIFDKLYYKEYTGDFLSNWRKSSNEENKAWLLFSNYFHNYLKQNLKYILILTIITAVIIILLSGILNGIKNIGISCIFIGIPFLFVGLIKKMIMLKLPQEASFASSFIDKILDIFRDRFLITFALGIILITIYVIVKKIKK
ncbi:MAG: hypothetical protein J7J93_01380 [Candidatus Aenigmarchaeota archaeon]|nr:hypothetical protein [Candidatus Aenigmarchaeota archaeon]